MPWLSGASGLHLFARRSRSTTIGLHDAATDGKQPGEGAYLTFACDDVAATVDELRGRGSQVTDPDEQPWGTVAFVQGPDGRRVRIHRKWPSPGSEERGIGLSAPVAEPIIQSSCGCTG